MKRRGVGVGTVVAGGTVVITGAVVAAGTWVVESEGPVPCPVEPENRGITTKYILAMTMMMTTAAARIKLFFGIQRGVGESPVEGDCGDPVSCACGIEVGRGNGGAGGEGGGGSSPTGAPQYLQNF